MALKKFKFNLEFLVEINDIEADACGAARTKEQIERQKQLYLALLDDQNFLTNYVKQFFIDMLEVEAKEIIQTQLFADDSQAESDPLVEAMEEFSPEDRDFFEQCLDEEMFITNATEFSLEKISMEEI